MSEGLSPGDPNSYSRPDEAVVTNIHLKLNVNFKLKVLSGTATLTVKRIAGSRLILDIGKDMNICKVVNIKTDQTLEYSVSEAIKTFGSKLEIKLPMGGDDSIDQGCGCIFLIDITYDTSPKATALQWLEPEQTAGRIHPYLFSQCEPIHCRTLTPCQDTPSVKMTYSAEVTAPAALVVLMSAVRVGEPSLVGDLKVYSFKQIVPIPSYLLAIAVGSLESRRLGPRSYVWSEKEIVDKAAFEFSETEQMLQAAEAICGPYVWGSYDLLVMPPSFPFGGMENPCLTFVTPTLLAGDRSLANVVAHEIAHSWTGNLVTNRNFEHFWLNEGFTVFVERKIIELLYNTEHRHFAAIGGLKELADTIKHRGENDPLTCLVNDLRGVDPDFAFSNVPYEKGHTFLFYLEELLGGPEAFNPFLKAYIEKFKYKSIDTDDFKTFLHSFFPTNEKLKDVDWDLWLHRPGMPPIIPKYNNAMALKCTVLANRWIEWDETTPSSFTIEDLKTLASVEMTEFLGQLLEHDPLSVVKLKTMRDTYNLNENHNAEIRFRWLRLCIKGQFVEQIDLALEFVTAQGRMKFVRPIFRDLYQWPEAKDKAVKTFMDHRPYMMHLTSSSVAGDLHIE